MRASRAWLLCISIGLFGCGGSSTSEGAGGTKSGGGTGGSAGNGGTAGQGGSGGTLPSGGGTAGNNGFGATGGTGAIGGSGGSGGAQSCALSGKVALGITINFTDPVRCTFTLAEAAAGISIAYQLVINQDVTDVVPISQATCAQPDASGLYVFEKVSGDSQSYCICDGGFCPQPPNTAITVKAGSYPGTFKWDGKNWSGPSDTGNPEGAPFPAGNYTLVVSTTGTHAGTPFTVAANLPITLLP